MQHHLDPNNMLGSVQALADQFQDAWASKSKLSFPEGYSNAANIVVSGMGGSALGTHIVEAAFANQLTVPVRRVQNYDLPAFINNKTLLILSSYSGTTEETIEAYTQGKKRGAMMLVLSTGGHLSDMAQADGVPVVTMQPNHNPSGQPRSAVGYSVGTQLAIFSTLGYLNITDDEMQRALAEVRTTAQFWSPEITDDRNIPAQLTQHLHNKVALLMSGPELFGATHTVNNQINETGKNFCVHFEIPELNHHLLEGLGFPKQNPQNLAALLIDWSGYRPENRIRIQVTQDVLNKVSIHNTLYSVRASTPLSAVIELLQLGAYISYYLGIANGVNPTPVPWVDYFKNQLKERK